MSQEKDSNDTFNKHRRRQFRRPDCVSSDLDQRGVGRSSSIKFGAGEEVDTHDYDRKRYVDCECKDRQSEQKEVETGFPVA